MGNFFRTISFGRFVLAFVISLMMWGYIQLNQFPENTVNFPNVYLNVIQPPTGYIVVKASQLPRTISVDVRGTADAVHNIVPSNIVAVLDLSHFNSNYNDDVAIDFSKTKIDGVNSFTATPAKISVHIEQQITKTLDVNLAIKGTAANYSSVGNPKLTPDKVTVTGPKSIVDQVEKANVVLDISSLTSSVTTQVNVTMADKNGLPIQDEDLKTTPVAVEVQLPISSQYVTKLVPVQVQTRNSAADGYVINSVKADPSVVTIFGLPEVVSNTTVINTQPIDIKGATGVVTATTDLIIPGGVVPSITKAQVTINFGLLGVEREVIVPVEFQNLPPGYSLLPASSSIFVILGGSRDALAQLPIGDVHAIADLAGKSPGALDNVLVQVTVPDSVFIKSQQPASINVTLVAPPTPTPTPRPEPTATPLPLPTYTPVPLPTYTPVPPTATVTPVTTPVTTTTTVAATPSSTPISQTKSAPSPVSKTPAPVTPSPTTPPALSSSQATDVPVPAIGTRQTPIPPSTTNNAPPQVTPRSVPITVPTVQLTQLYSS